jgi:hypothetical protein
MPRPSSVTVGSATTSAAVPINWRGHQGSNIAVSIGCVLTGASTYKVQHTFDDIFDPSVTPTWFDHASITGKTTSADGNYAFPIRAVRLNVTPYTSGAVTMTVLEAY